MPIPVVYDPMVSQDLVERQLHDFEEFLRAVDMVVVLVGHSHLKHQIDMLANKIILDTRNIISDVNKL